MGVSSLSHSSSGLMGNSGSSSIIKGSSDKAALTSREKNINGDNTERKTWLRSVLTPVSMLPL